MSVVADFERPPTFQRAQVVLRVALLCVVGWIAHPIGLLWLGVPALAAIRIGQKDGQRYVAEDGGTVSRVLGWLVALLAYLSLVTDRLPGDGEAQVRFEVERSGAPTVGSALLRIVYAIPRVILLAVLLWVGAFVWMIAAVCVLVGERYPEGLWRFLRGIVRREAHLLVYLSSLA